MMKLWMRFMVIVPLLAVALHAHSREEIDDALALICDRPEVIGSDEYVKAVQVSAASFTSVDLLAKLGVSDEALAWMPTFGPCAGPSSPLLIAFFASVTRDDISGRKDRIIYRGWRVVLAHYAYLRKTASDEDFPEIPALEEMARKEKSGVLLREAEQLERKKV